MPPPPLQQPQPENDSKRKKPLPWRRPCDKNRKIWLANKKNKKDLQTIRTKIKIIIMTMMVLVIKKHLNGTCPLTNKLTLSSCRKVLLDLRPLLVSENSPVNLSTSKPHFAPLCQVMARCQKSEGPNF